MTAADESREPFWSYEDLALFLGSVLPWYVLAALAVRLMRLSNDALRTLVFQSLIYGLLLGTLYVLISVRYGRPFWRSLGFTMSYPGAWFCVGAGPLLAIGLAQLEWVLKTPVTPSPFEELIGNRLSLAITMLFVTVFGPVFEELVFRGFLFPLLARSLGPWQGIVLSAGLFGLLHGSQYHWAWQSVLVVGLAGVVFGIARYKTGSTLGGATVHVGYNVTLFAAFLMQRWV